VPVPTDIGDLSTAAASNSPSGSDQRSQADDYLRAHAAIIKQFYNDERVQYVSVKDYGAVGDGSTDDTDAIQDAIDAVCAEGGSVFFPAGLYKVTDEITVSSLYPVHLFGCSSGQIYNGTVANAGLVIGGNIAGSMILYTAPDSGTRAAHGGGSVRHLSFFDATSNAVPGTYTCTAALELNDFATSTVQDCTFSGINGSAIKGEFVVMTRIVGNNIRYCGATSKPAVYFPSTSSSFPAQSLSILDNRIEVCQDAAYLSVGANASCVKITNNGFEADTTVADSNQEFMTLAGIDHSVTGNHFNRNTGSQATLSCSSSSFNGNSFSGGVYATTSVTVSGSRNAFSGNTFNSARTAIEVLLSGESNAFSGNTVHSSGQVKITGNCNVVSGNTFFENTCTTAALGAGSDFWVYDTSSLSNISGNVFTNSGGSVTTVGAVKVTGTCPSVNGNTFRAFAGSGNGAIAIRNESSNSVITANVEANCTTFISTSSYAGEISGNMPTTAAAPLSGSTTWNPGDLADGVTESTTVTVTGAAVGDFVEVSLGVALQNLILSGEVSAADTVTATLLNETGGNINLASSTLKAKVSKR
jgi:hypothetical protein